MFILRDALKESVLFPGMWEGCRLVALENGYWERQAVFLKSLCRLG